MTAPGHSTSTTSSYTRNRARGGAPLSEERALAEDLSCILSADRVLTRPIQRVAWAFDASFYRLIPRAVVFPLSIDEIVGLFTFCRARRVPMTFRAAGTSLSGQAISDGILVEVARHWRGVRVEDDGRAIRIQPGVIGAHANLALRPYGRKIGPDPASISACTVGGILANNSSGMCCGVARNAYHTIRSMTFVLPSGTVVDTSDPAADERLRHREPHLVRGLLELREALVSRPDMLARIRAKYRTKNTTGYSLNAFLDFERPVEMMRNLLIGSEGTLAFIAEAVLETIPDLPVKRTGLLLFRDLHAACSAIPTLRDAGAEALELMDRAALRSVESQAGIPESIGSLPEGAAGLLVEFQTEKESDRQELVRTADRAVSELPLLDPPRFTSDPREQAQLWKIRQGMLPSVGAVRRSGTSAIIEDVAFPVDRLADAAIDLSRLFRAHGYEDAIIFGHAKDGNLHFVISQAFSGPEEIAQYARFMDDLVELVVKRYDGALKAEHGTGRNMAPFVEAEWGSDALAIMRRLKGLIDPDEILNPGVIVNPDPQVHLENLKSLPSVEDEVDRCIECGYCEPVCPSRELTMTPRQRIVVRRELARLETAGASKADLASIKDEYAYQALHTCAVDGLCATACPVGIDTGELTKRLRRRAHSSGALDAARGIAQNLAAVECLARLALTAGHAAQAVLGSRTVASVSRAAATFVRMPTWQWIDPMPHPAAVRLPKTPSGDAHAVYFPSCIARVMGRLAGEPDGMSQMEAFVEVSRRASTRVRIPRDVRGTCCGVPFSSKGFDAAHAVAANRAIERFWRWSDGGNLPVVVDTSPCAYGLRTCRNVLTAVNQDRFDRLRILDSIEFVHDELLPKLRVARVCGRVALHPVCSVVKMDLTSKLEAIVRACASEVLTPPIPTCCGFAGDRGFLHPELTASATRLEAESLRDTPVDGAYASSRTCEIGLSRSTGLAFRSYLFLLEVATRDGST
jgi:D-lactate dehydrogenase